MIGKDFKTPTILNKVIDICENYNISYNINWEVEEAGCTVYFDSENDLNTIEDKLQSY